MKETIKIGMALFAVLILFAQKSFAQSPDIRTTYVFSGDSVAGFDEGAASIEALAHHCYGDEYKAFLYIQKRNFIKQKYNLKTVVAQPLTLFQNPEVSNRTSAAVGNCNNEDFELGTIQGWLAQSGTNPNSCGPPALSGNGQYTVYNTPILDQKLGFFVGSYFDAGTNVTPAGSGFVLLNDNDGFNEAVKLTKQFLVTTSNALFQYAYLPVIQNGDHVCCEQPGFNIHVTITNTVNNTSTVLACPQISVAVPGSLCPYTPAPGEPVFAPTPNDATWLYHNWRASVIDLTPYIGFQVTLEVVVVDCQFTAHGAYAYFDAKCLAMDILGNGQAFPAGTPSVTLPSCGATSATICAPDGTGPYTWAGPGVVAPYNVPSMSNQCYSTSISNNFTLTMNPPGSCQPIKRVVTVTITPAPFIIPNVIQASCGGTMATVNYTAAGSASVNPTIIWSPAPTATTANQNLGSATFPPGTGIVTLTAKDPLGCKVTTTLEIKPVPQQPTLSILNITGSNSITCITPTVDLTAVVIYTSGNLNYLWSSNSFTSTADTITVVNSSTLITLTVKDPSNGCTASATTAIQMNTVAPVTSLAPVTQSVGCGVGVTPQTATSTAISPNTNVTHYWYSPGLQTPQQTNGGATSVGLPVIVGPISITTVQVCNNINGCCTSKTLEVISTGGSFPTFSLSSNQSFSLGCASRSLTTINIVNPQSGSGGVVSFTLLAPGFSGPTYTTSPQSTYTVSAPGPYTVIVRDNANNCETRFPVSIIQNTFAPNISSSAISRTLSCAVPSMVLNGVSSNTPAVPIDFSWSFQNGSNPNVINNYSLVVNTQAPFTNSVINTYTLTIIDQNNACKNSTVVTMWQNTRPPIAAISPSLSSLTCATYSINMSNNSVTGIINFPIAYPLVGELWEGPTPHVPKTNSSSYLAFVPGTYTMTVKDMNNGCSAKATATVLDERDYPVLATNTLVALDCGAQTKGVALTVTVVGMPSSAVTATWYPPVPTPSTSSVFSLNLNTTGIGEYVIAVRNTSNSCMSQKIVNVVNGSLTAQFTPDQNTGYAPLTVNFTNNSSSTNSVTGTQSITSVWSYGNGTTKTMTTNAGTSVVYTAPGTYSVTMFASKGTCLDTAQQIIVVDIPSKLEVPNVFTPNGDGTNDLFFIRSANLTSITAQVFDRWGNKIYELSTDKGNIAWDGKNQMGKEVPDGTYFYTIKATGKDGQSYDTKGTVSLYR